MFQVNDSCFVDLKFEGFDVGLLPTNFVKATLIEDARGIITPVLSLTLSQPNRDLYRYLKRGLLLEFTFGNNSSNAKTYKFRLVNYNYSKADATFFNLELSCLLDVFEFTNSTDIRFVDGTSDEVFKDLKTVTPDVDYEGDDEQVWIQHNNSEKDFAERVLSHAYVDEDDFVVAALTLDSKLVARSTKKVLDEGVHKYTFHQEIGDLNIQYTDFSVKTDGAIWSKLLSEGRPLVIVSRDGRDNDILFPSKHPPLLDKNVSFPPQLDSLNCHENYYQAWINNLSNAVDWMSDVVYTDSGRRILNNDELQLLDPVMFLPNNPEADNFVSDISGKYILIYKETWVTQKASSQVFQLARGANDQQV